MNVNQSQTTIGMKGTSKIIFAGKFVFEGVEPVYEHESDAELMERDHLSHDHFWRGKNSKN